MMTTTVLAAVFFACLAVAFSVLSKARSPRFAFLAICWLPLASLGLIYALGNQLGYAVIAYLLIDVIASIVIVGIGAQLLITAVEPKRGRAALMLGTLIAALPLAIFAVLLAH